MMEWEREIWNDMHIEKEFIMSVDLFYVPMFSFCFIAEELNQNEQYNITTR